ncbi:MAG: hypothetical protein HY680_06180 [Chloroflexi bacterium]|nr:hypothetical protein [Chloroflexota bacterium]
MSAATTETRAKPKPITRTALRKLVGQLPESELVAAHRYLCYLRDVGDPFLRALKNAPLDDEPSTPGEDAAADKAWQEYLEGKAMSAEEAKGKLLA